MADLTSTRTRSDLIIGGLVVLASLVILGNAAVATTVSVKFLGWILFTVVLVVGGLMLCGVVGPCAFVADADDVEEELLVEEISIDGMCGVY